MNVVSIYFFFFFQTVTNGISGPEVCIKFYNKSEYKKSEQCFMKLYIKTSDTDFLYASSYALYMEGFYDKAYKRVQKYIKLSENKGDGYFLRGLIFLKQNKELSSLKSFLKAEKLGLVNESKKELREKIKEVKSKIRKLKKSNFNLSLSAGYDSSPYASDVGELIVSEEDSSFFFGLDAFYHKNLYLSDFLSISTLYKGNWKIYSTYVESEKGKSSSSRGRMLTSSSGFFGFSSNDAGIDIGYKNFNFKLSGILESLDPFYDAMLLGIKGSVLFENTGAKDKSVKLEIKKNSAVSSDLQAFEGYGVTLSLMHELPAPGASVIFAGGSVNYSDLGVSDSIECDSDEGCPVEISWKYIKLDTSLTAVIPFNNYMLGLGCGYAYFNQLDETSVNTGTNTETFYRKDHKFSSYILLKKGKSNFLSLKLSVIHNISNAAYQWYNFNYTRWIISVSSGW